MRAEAHAVVAGGNLDVVDVDQRGWLTNWPLHLVVIVTALLSAVASPGLGTALVTALWVGAYAAAHWLVVVRGLPGAPLLAGAVLILLALALMHVSGQGMHLFAAFMVMWVLQPSYRGGLAATLLLAGGLVLVMLPGALEHGSSGIAVALATGTGIGLFSVLLGTWVWRTERLSAERRELAEELALTVATLERTREELLAVERRRGAQEEASRLAAEIHDTLAQSFTSITMLIQAARQTSPPPAALLTQIEELSRDGLAQARALIVRTQPPLDLAASLDRLATDLQERTGIRAEVRSEHWSPLSTRAEVVLLRTLQEALRNIEHHAGAGAVRIRLAREGEGAVLEIIDDGDGFDPALPTAGYGLLGMRSRLEAEGGTLELSSVRAEGTTVRATLPGVMEVTRAR